MPNLHNNFPRKSFSEQAVHFLIATPYQALNAFQAIHLFKQPGSYFSIGVVTEQGTNNSAYRTAYRLREMCDIRVHLYTIPPVTSRNALWAIPINILRLCKHTRKRSPSLKNIPLLFANYTTHACWRLCSLFGTAQIYVLDDGNSTVSCLHQLGQGQSPSLGTSSDERSLLDRLKSIRTWRGLLNPVRLISKLMHIYYKSRAPDPHEAVWFTQHYKLADKYDIPFLPNDFSIVKNLKAGDRPRSSITVVLGQPLVERGGYPDSKYISHIQKISNVAGRRTLYVPHPAESGQFVQKVTKNTEVTLWDTTLPFELEYLLMDSDPHHIISFFLRP